MNDLLDRLNARQAKLVNRVADYQKPLVAAIVDRTTKLTDGRWRERAELSLARLPSATQLVEKQFTFAQRVLDTNHKLAARLAATVDALRPVAEGSLSDVETPLADAQATEPPLADAQATETPLVDTGTGTGTSAETDAVADAATAVEPAEAVEAVEAVEAATPARSKRARRDKRPADIDDEGDTPAA